MAGCHLISGDCQHERPASRQQTALRRATASGANKSTTKAMAASGSPDFAAG